MKVDGWELAGSKVLVTGASGFKGSWLCATLHKLGAQVYGTVRHQIHPESAFNYFGLQEKIRSTVADVSDRQQIYDLINTVEPAAIFHLAAKALVPVGLRDPRRTFDVNISGTLNIIEACRRLKVCNRLLICSTDHVFGNVEPTAIADNGFDETSRVSYGGPYDTSKAAMELLVRSYHYTYWNEVPAMGITRCANVFGCGDVNLRRVIPEFVSTAKSTGLIPLKYRRNGRQFIYITDAIAGYIKAMAFLSEGGWQVKTNLQRPESRTPFTPTFHFALEKYEGTTKPYIEMGAVAALTGRLFGAKVIEPQTDYAPNENRAQALNCSSTRNHLHWEPQVSLKEGLLKLALGFELKNDIAGLRDIMESEVNHLIQSLMSGEQVLGIGA